MISNSLSLKAVALFMAFNSMYVYGFTCIAFNEYQLVNITVDEEIDRDYRPTIFTDNPFTVLELLEGKKVTNSNEVDKIIHDIFWGETNSTSDECIQIEDLVELDENEASTAIAFLKVSRNPLSRRLVTVRINADSKRFSSLLLEKIIDRELFLSFVDRLTAIYTEGISFGDSLCGFGIDKDTL